MAIFGDYSRLFRLFYVREFAGNNAFSLNSFVSTMKRFVFDEKAEDVIEKKFGCKRKLPANDSTSSFAAEVESALYLFPVLNSRSAEVFREFHDFTLTTGNPMGSVLASKRNTCRICNEALSVDMRSHVVVIYHAQRGTYLGSRLMKFCRGCKLHEHYGYWTLNGQRHFDENCLENEFLLSSEDTAFDMSLIRQCGNFLVVGAVPFSTFAKTYNRQFGYSVEANEDSEGQLAEEPKGSVKRMKRLVSFLNKCCSAIASFNTTFCLKYVMR